MDVRLLGTLLFATLVAAAPAVAEPTEEPAEEPTEEPSEEPTEEPAPARPSLVLGMQGGSDAHPMAGQPTFPGAFFRIGVRIDERVALAADGWLGAYPVGPDEFEARWTAQFLVLVSPYIREHERVDMSIGLGASRTAAYEPGRYVLDGREVGIFPSLRVEGTVLWALAETLAAGPWLRLELDGLFVRGMIHGDDGDHPAHRLAIRGLQLLAGPRWDKSGPDGFVHLVWDLGLGFAYGGEEDAYYPVGRVSFGVAFDRRPVARPRMRGPDAEGYPWNRSRR